MRGDPSALSREDRQRAQFFGSGVVAPPPEPAPPPRRAPPPSAASSAFVSAGSGTLCVLSIDQPHATAILLGLKPTENRCWQITIKPGTKGRWIALHATRRANWGLGRAGSPAAAKFEACTRAYGEGMPRVAELPSSVIIGFFRVRKCVKVAGGWHWVINRVLALESHVELKGQQGLRPLPVNLEIEVPDEVRLQCAA